MSDSTPAVGPAMRAVVAALAEHGPYPCITHPDLAEVASYRAVRRAIVAGLVALDRTHPAGGSYGAGAVVLTRAGWVLAAELAAVRQS